MSWRVAVLALAVSSTLAAMPTAAAPRLVVHDVRTEGLPPHLVGPLNEFILTEFQNAGRYEVLGGSDIVALLEREVQKQLMGCDDQQCLAEIAGAMNAQFIASSTVGKLGDAYLVNIKIIDARTISVVTRASVKSLPEEEQLMAAARTAVRVVSANATMVDELPSIEPLPIVLVSVAAAALGTGIGFGVKADGHYRDFMNPAYPDFAGAARDGEMSQIVANVAFGAALISATAAVLTWWFGGDRVEVLPDEPSGASPAAAWGGAP